MIAIKTNRTNGIKVLDAGLINICKFSKIVKKRKTTAKPTKMTALFWVGTVPLFEYECGTPVPLGWCCENAFPHSGHCRLVGGPEKKIFTTLPHLLHLTFIMLIFLHNVMGQRPLQAQLGLIQNCYNNLYIVI